MVLLLFLFLLQFLPYWDFPRNEDVFLLELVWQTSLNLPLHRDMPGVLLKGAFSFLP
jgi:hypothetical protein